MKILHKNCDPELAKDKGLPIDSYLVSYYDKDELCFDLVLCNSQVVIFDYYYDQYGKGSPRSIKWTNGTVNNKCISNKKSKAK